MTNRRPLPKHLRVPEKVLALDPGSATFGWAIFLDGRPYSWGVRRKAYSKTWRSLPAYVARDRMARLILLDGDPGEILTDPSTLVVIETTNEHVHPGKPTKGIVSAATMIGHVESHLARLPNRAFMVPRRTWAGNRSDDAVKHQMQVLVGKKLTQDAADALGIGHWFVSFRWMQLTSEKEKGEDDGNGS